MIPKLTERRWPLWAAQFDSVMRMPQAIVTNSETQWLVAH